MRFFHLFSQWQELWVETLVSRVSGGMRFGRGDEMSGSIRLLHTLSSRLL